MILAEIPQTLTGTMQITCEKEHKKQNEKVPDVSNTVALIITAATKYFPVLKNVPETKFISWQAECQTIITKALKDYRG